MDLIRFSERTSTQDHPVRYVILDFSCVAYLDTDGLSLIAKLANDLKSINCKLLIAQANVTVSKNLAIGQKRLSVSHEVWPKIFVTIDAAINCLLETSPIYRANKGFGLPGKR